MRLLRLLGVVVVAALVAATVSTLILTRRAGEPVGRGPLPQVGQPDGPQNAAQRAAPAVVRIETGPPGGASPVAAAAITGETLAARTGGTGVVVDARGYILTAETLVAGAAEITVAIPGGKTVEARVVGSDPQTALTMLKVEVSNLKTVAIAGGGPQETGSGVVLMAAPPAFGVAVGAVASAHGSTAIDDPSSPGRRRVLNDLLALDIASRDGQLGAPLLDGAGRLLGLVIVSGRQTWAADIANAQTSVQQLIEGGRVTYPSLGFDYQQLSVTEAADRGLPGGVVVLKVLKATSAEQIGLQVGDVVTAMGGTTLDPSHPLMRLVRGLAVRQTVSLSIRTAGADRTVSLTVALLSP